MTKYAKLFASVVATVLVALVGVMTDNEITSEEWILVAIAGTNAAAVFASPNVPGAVYTKSILAVLGAVLAGLVSMISGGLSTPELMQVAVLALGALGVYAVPNTENGVNLSTTGNVGVA